MKKEWRINRNLVGITLLCAMRNKCTYGEIWFKLWDQFRLRDPEGWGCATEGAIEDNMTRKGVGWGCEKRHGSP